MLILILISSVAAYCKHGECRSLCRDRPDAQQCRLDCQENCGLFKCEERIYESLDDVTFDISGLIENENHWTVKCRNPQDMVIFQSTPFENMERRKITIGCDLKFNQACGFENFRGAHPVIGLD